tara:strand:+ start:2290 stop:3279 length:990 start_codon:yes stop_codon:yes gene_type:complete
MAHKMKFPKGKGFPFKDSESPFEDDRFDRWGGEVDHIHGGEFGTDEYSNVEYPDNNAMSVVIIHENNEGEPIGTSWDDTGTEGDDMYFVDDNMTGEIETDIDWGEAVNAEGDTLIEPSLDPDAESVLGQQAREREESGAHRWSRGGQSENPEDPVYPWSDDNESDFSNDPPKTEQDNVSYLWENPNWGTRPPLDDNVSYTWERPNWTKPTLDTFGNEVSPVGGGGSTDIRPNVSTTSDRPNERPNVSTLSDRPKPTSPPNTSPVGSGPNNERPNVSLANQNTATDIFGNEVSPINNRGNKVPFSTVTTPGKFSLGRKGESTKGNRKFRK